jgi:hypothetical protein
MIKNIDLHKVLQNYQTGNVELQQDKLLVEAYNILNGTNIKSTINEDFDYSSESNILNELTITRVLDSNHCCPIKVQINI